jgi:ATP-binding cassette subfamily F protein 3
MDAVAACAELLGGLDEDTLEYVAGALVDDGEVLPKEDIADFLVPLLVDAEVCRDEDAAAALADELWARLTGSSSGGESSADAAGSAAAADGGPKLLTAKISIKDSAKRYDDAAAEASAKRTDLRTLNSEVDVSNAEDDPEMMKRRNAKLIASLEKMAAEVQAETASVDAELAAASQAAASMKLSNGAAQMASVECREFSLPNPGGGPNLLDDAAFVLAPGHRYALIGRNGKGKSTLLRWLAARRVGNLPAELCIHYVSQEVSLTEADEGALPVDVVLAADVERRILLAELAELEAAALASAGEPEPESEPAGLAAGGAARSARLAKLEGEGSREERQIAVVERLQGISADAALGRAETLLVNLGFTAELRGRPMRMLSGGWRVRVALAAALFAKPDILLLDEPTNHLSIDAVLWLQRELAESPTHLAI